jgi:hypothetical protein
MKKPLDCVFCNELESIQHLFFDCIVAKHIWEEVELMFGTEIHSFETVASCWLSEIFKQINVISTAIL